MRKKVREGEVKKNERGFWCALIGKKLVGIVEKERDKKGNTKRKREGKRKRERKKRRES